MNSQRKIPKNKIPTNEQLVWVRKGEGMEGDDITVVPAHKVIVDRNDEKKGSLVENDIEYRVYAIAKHTLKTRQINNRVNDYFFDEKSKRYINTKNINSSSDIKEIRKKEESNDPHYQLLGRAVKLYHQRLTTYKNKLKNGIDPETIAPPAPPHTSTDPYTNTLSSRSFRKEKRSTPYNRNELVYVYAPNGGDLDQATTMVPKPDEVKERNNGTYEWVDSEGTCHPVSRISRYVRNNRRNRQATKSYFYNPQTHKYINVTTKSRYSKEEINTFLGPYEFLAKEVEAYNKQIDKKTKEGLTKLFPQPLHENGNSKDSDKKDKKNKKRKYSTEKKNIEKKRNKKRRLNKVTSNEENSDLKIKLKIPKKVLQEIIEKYKKNPKENLEINEKKPLFEEKNKSNFYNEGYSPTMFSKIPKDQNQNDNLRNLPQDNNEDPQDNDKDSLINDLFYNV